MKKLSKQFFAVLLTLIISVFSFAQDKGVDVNVDVNKGGNWYQQPWVWIVGGALFILLLVALLRGSGSKNEA